MPRFRPPGQCPACGEWVPRKAAACDCCGACERSGWKSETNVYDGLDLPDEDFDYDAFVAEEFGEGQVKRKMSNVWWWVAVLLLLILGFGMLVPILGAS